MPAQATWRFLGAQAGLLPECGSRERGQEIDTALQRREGERHSCDRDARMTGNVLYMEFPSEDVDRAQRFWSGVLGWEFGNGLTEAFDYRMAQAGPDAAVAITPADEPGHPNVYIETADLDAALVRVRELGGEAGEIREVPGRLAAELPATALYGRFAGCKDSEGNAFDLMQRDASVS